MDMWVASSDDGCTEFFDDVEYLVCGECGETTYKSIDDTPPPPKAKTTKILGGVGSRQVMWLIDGEWVHKGWLLPQAG
jgi:hypothetical protein